MTREEASASKVDVLKQIEDLVRSYAVTLAFTLQTLEDEGIEMPRTRDAEAFLRSEAERLGITFRETR